MEKSTPAPPEGGRGRAPLGERDDVGKNRREEAGDRIRAEYEEAWETRTS